MKSLHRPETVAMQDGCVILHYSNDDKRQATFDFMEWYGSGDQGYLTAPSPSLYAIEAAAQVFNDNGLPINLPTEGDLDDVEQERYNALCDALAAAYDKDQVRFKPLVWNEYHREGNLDELDAETPFGTYYNIRLGSEGWWLTYDLEFVCGNEDLDELKNAAQQDYEKRLRSAYGE